MNPKSPRAATRLPGTGGTGALNTGSYGSSQIWPPSAPACRTPRTADRASGAGRDLPARAASSRGRAVVPHGVLQQHAPADRVTGGIQRLPVAGVLGGFGVVPPPPQNAPQLRPPGA